jgi:NhaP-type Na+/H+ or K+/H+ antiporter
MAQLEFIERLERLLEVGTILLLGSILLWQPMLKYAWQSLVIILFLFLVIRPIGAWISTIGQRPLRSQRRRFHPATRLLFGWFGIRGVGSLYYLAYAFSHGLKGEVSEQISWITYTTIVVSVVIHGISATPLMNWYEHQVATQQSVPHVTMSELEDNSQN